MEQKTALIVGATGLVGKHLCRLLLEDMRYARVKIFVRREPGISHPKLDVQIVNFDDPESWQLELAGDELFSCMGTTLRTAGSKDAQYKVDYTYQFQAAENAAKNGVKTLVLVSSAGANAKSRIFYSRIKGELDRDVQSLGFDKVRIIKPSVLDGKRDESRIGERMSIGVFKFLSPILPFIKKYKPIHAHTVAQAMINAANLELQAGAKEYELNAVFDLAERLPGD